MPKKTEELPGVTTTTEKQKWSASEARAVAAELVRELRAATLPTPEHMRSEWPHPNLIAVAGSLRRMKAMVGDVEILFVPVIELAKSGLFSEDVTELDHAELAIESMFARVIISKRPKKDGTLTWGPQNKLAVHVASGIPVDFFATTSEDWWTALVIRTGPAKSNINLATLAPRHGYHLHAYGSFTRVGADGREKVIARNEREVFKLAGAPWKEPKDR